MYSAAFGLLIRSALPLASLPTVEPGDPDVVIDLAVVPAVPEPYASAGFLYRVDPATATLQVDGVARFRIADGERIGVHTFPGSRPDMIERHLLGPAWGALLHQRGLLALHAASNCVDGGAVLFVGDPGVGKSTLSFALSRSGYGTIADDITGISFEGGRPHAVPGFAHTRMWADSARALGESLDGLPRVSERYDKYYVPVKSQARRPAPVRAIFELCPSQTGNFALETTSRSTGFRIIAAHTYRPEFLDDLDLRRAHFRKVSDLVVEIDVHRIVRPRSGFRIDELVAFVARTLEEM